MSSTLKVKLMKRGVRALLKSDEVKGACMDLAAKMQAQAGPGYEVEERNYPERSGAAVFTGDADAFYDNLTNNTLEKVRRSV